MNIIWLELILMFIGIFFIILAFFKPKNDILFEEKIEKTLEGFISHVEIENEEILQRIKEVQESFSDKIEERLSEFSKRLENMEKNNKNEKELPQINSKYKEVLNLYNNGEDINSIARKTQIAHGEIELILDLVKKGFKYV